MERMGRGRGRERKERGKVIWELTRAAQLHNIHTNCMHMYGVEDTK